MPKKSGGSSSLGTLLALHLLLMVYSTSSILSKLASGEPFLSPRFILLYGGMIGLLGVYAIAWQQIIKRLPLTTAYANRAVTLVWGIVWGVVFFHEGVTLLKLLGAAIVLAGVVLYATAEGDGEQQDGRQGESHGTPAEPHGGDAA